MDLDQTIKTRRTIRQFSEKKIDSSDIESIIDAARWAPSACNFQQWKFIVIDDDEVKKLIVDAGGSKLIAKAAVGILVLYTNFTSNQEYRDNIQTAAAATQNMLLKAWSLGFGACWLGHLPPKQQLRNQLSIPNQYDPIAYVALGYPESVPAAHPRREKLDEIIAYNAFSFSKFEQATTKRIGNRWLRKVYDGLPIFVKKWLRPITEKYFVKRF